MTRPLPRSGQLFAVALVGTFAAALMPSSWLRPWTGEVSQLVQLPVTPFAHVGNKLRAWLRSPNGMVVEGDPESLDEAMAEMVRTRQMYDAAELRIRELEARVEQLQQFPVRDLPEEVRMQTATVVGRDPTSTTGLVELNRGDRHGVNQTAIAVHEVVHLVGRVTAVDRLRSHVLPVTSRNSGSIQAAIVAADRLGDPITQFPEVELRPIGDGTFHADIAREHDASEGDVVKLTDERWPSAARARILGIVESIHANDDAPLREVLVIRPVYQATDVGDVTLLVEPDDMESGGSA